MTKFTEEQQNGDNWDDADRKNYIEPKFEQERVGFREYDETSECCPYCVSIREIGDRKTPRPGLRCRNCGSVSYYIKIASIHHVVLEDESTSYRVPTDRDKVRPPTQLEFGGQSRSTGKF